MTQHISVRVPWKDNGYNGLICNKPCNNTACMRLANIAENKNDVLEEKLAGCSILGHENDIPCLTEGGCFMSPKSFIKKTNHPYKQFYASHKHFLETDLEFKPFSFPSRPFGWTMKKKENGLGEEILFEELADRKGIDYNPDFEPLALRKKNWIQDARNQRAIFKTFYEDIKTNRSLVIAYAKQVPFIEDAKRVVIGVGFITNVVEPPEYRTTNESELHSILWETMLEHSIRDDRKNGFIIPYKEMLEYAAKHPDFDMSEIAVLTDDEYFNEFSFASEHLSYDAVINVLLKCIKSFKIIRDYIPGNWDECIKWCKERLEEVWLDRGPFPGLGSMLFAAGFKHGELIAKEAGNKIHDIFRFEEEFYSLLDNYEDNFSSHVQDDLSPTRVKLLKNMPEERKKLFWLLSRIYLTEEQAVVIFDKQKREQNNILCSEEEIINNPYCLYERTRGCSSALQIPVTKIDMAIFPPDIISKSNPIPKPSCLKHGDDERRIRALAIKVLEEQTCNGHTVFPKTMLVEEINKLPLDPECQITEDIIDVLMDFLGEEFKIIKCANGEDAFQLNRLFNIDAFIRSELQKRMKLNRYEIKEEWDKILNTHPKVLEQEKQEFAERERIASLKELAASPFTVLIGGAGTGKTTLIKDLCLSPDINNAGILVLAPTGKARVRIAEKLKNDINNPSEPKINYEAKTVAQFLVHNKRYDGKTKTYLMTGQAVDNVPGTVVIDESSMLTEEMMGAVLEAVKSASRIILVGDPNQLPPIGAGRPFVDIVNYLSTELPPKTEPQVTKGYCELTVTFRQKEDKSEEREDVILSKWFTNNTDDLPESIFSQIQAGNAGSHIEIVKYDATDNLQSVIMNTICKVTNMKSVDDIQGFNESIGGYINKTDKGNWMNFSINKLEDWQILSAYKNDATIGSATINRFIHDKYKSAEKIELKECMIRSTPNLLGIDGIVYGEKVINTRNQKKRGSPYNSENLNYVANGEVGIVEGLTVKKNYNDDTDNQHRIKFNSQPECSYYWYSSISDEGNDIELAYALTVHKAQGSEFRVVILVLNEPSRMISKELLYTALTRQLDKIIILYNDEPYKLKKYTSMAYSDIAKRFTCLFEAPDIVEIQKRCYENRLIHRTLRGEMVRSKSEVIIANLLDSKSKEMGFDYKYEKDLILANGSTIHPDFTIEMPGKVIYWEHLGMLGDKKYSRDWKQREKDYQENGIVKGKNLIISKDGLDGSLDTLELEKLIEENLRI